MISHFNVGVATQHDWWLSLTSQMRMLMYSNQIMDSKFIHSGLQTTAVICSDLQKGTKVFSEERVIH